MTAINAATPERLRPAPRLSATHASFDFLKLEDANGTKTRIGLIGKQRFYQQRGRSYEDAIAGAQELARKTGIAQAVIAAHPGMVFVAPAYVRSRPSSPVDNVELRADLQQLQGLTPTGRHGAVWALAGADSIIDMRELPPVLGSAPA